MDKQDAIERLCRLGGEVAGRQFHWRAAADCLCGHGESNPPPGWSFDFSEDVMSFIEAAVEARLVQNGK